MKRHKRLLLGLAMFGSIAGFAALPAFPQIATPVVTAAPDRPSTVPFDLFRGNRIFLTGKLNGVETPMILDTGASVTAMSHEFAERLGLKDGQPIEALGAGGEQQAMLYQDMRLDVGGISLSGVTMVSIDLTHIEKGIGRKMPVILGRDFLTSAVVGVDFAERTLTIAPRQGFKPPADAHEVALKAAGPLFTLPVKIGTLPPVDAMFDLGSGGALSLSPEYHRRHAMFAKLPTAASMSGGVGGLHENRVTTLPVVSMGGFSFDQVPAALETVEDGPYKDTVNAGIQLFRPFRLTLDLGAKRIFLQRGRQPVTFDRNRAGLFVDLDGNQLAVRHVAPGSPAARAGIEVGDRFDRVDDTPVTTGFYASAAGDWMKGPAGTRVRLGRAGKAPVELVLADYY